ncbi:MAG: hypothetical protein QNJ98_01135 [Planctomycetota bacterium]|nr:hypothetical protein [Planctomycetota bacterium]
MKRDSLIPFGALLFFVLALPSAGLLRLPLVPETPSALLRLYGVLAAGLLLMATVRRDAGERVRGAGWRPLALALALAPFFLYAIWAAPAQAIRAEQPALALPVLVLLLMCFGAAGRRAATATVVTLTLLFGGGAVLARAGLDPWPAAWNPLRQPTTGAVPPGLDDALRVGVRPGAPVRVDAEAMPLGDGNGPWWRPASVARVPLRPPIALIFDGAADARGLDRDGDVSMVHQSEVDIAHAMDLDGFDAVVVLEKGWSPADPSRARRLATAVTGFVRRGGLLIGPPPERRWPPSLARRLGPAGQAQRTGPGGLRALGMGRVVRALTGDEMLGLLESELWVRPVRTVFDRATVAPKAPPEFVTRGDPRSPRRPAVFLLGTLVLVLAAFDWILRGAAMRTLGALMAALAVATGIAWVVPSDPGFALAGVRLELGGVGGRSVEAVRIEAGSGGYAGRVAFGGSGMVRVLGGRIDAEGRVLVAPDTAAWVVREGLGLGAGPEETDDRFAGWALGFLKGRVDPKRVRYARLPVLPVRVEGAGPVGAVVVHYRGG